MARMASILHFLVISLCCSFLFFLSESQTDPQSHGAPNTRNKPNLLVLPVQHDASSGLHWANIHKRTPLMQVPVLVDLNGKHLWVNCDQHYSSSTYQAPFCHSTQCSRANTHLCHTCVSASRPGCHNNTCGLMSSNPVTEETGIGELAQDVLAIQTTTNTRGSRLGPMVRVPQFLFSCAPSFLAQKGLPNNVQGVAGLGHAPISLPNQLSSYFGLQRQFTMCLSRNPSSNGAILFGDAPNNMRYNQDIFHDLAYTPLTISPHLGEYYIQITSIRINQHNVVPFNPTMLSSNPEGVMGGTLITTTAPYTVLHESIFETFAKLYANQIPRQAQVNAVGPFGLCFDSKRMGAAAPYVDLVMDKPNVVWRISGENLMVQARPGVTCLGIVNGGKNARAPIAIGARQLEENVVVVDLARSRLGFSTSLQSHGKKCADLFDFNNPA
ncbi:basic 7S globulin-like [Gastrolobium bilobum]|uniref:basic 7S globulin-like n=1 Tax=Gastrolobium bilobum TaxID=150636 RepID=UPI002AB0FE59|nr:basic 7S globulin-like [Gastrolobium bilobum]